MKFNIGDKVQVKFHRPDIDRIGWFEGEVTSINEKGGYCVVVPECRTNTKWGTTWSCTDAVLRYVPDSWEDCISRETAA